MKILLTYNILLKLKLYNSFVNVTRKGSFMTYSTNR